MSCAKCHQAPPETGDTWCAACSAWEALASELAAPWHSRALRHLVTEQVEHLVRSVRALRNFSSSLKSAEASRAAAERPSQSVSKQAPPPPPPPPPVKKEPQESSSGYESPSEEEDGETGTAAATAAKSKASRPEREEAEPEKAEEERRSPVRPRSPKGPPPREASREREDHREGDKKKKKRKDRDRTRRGNRAGRNHQRLYRALDKPDQPLHRKRPASYWDEHLSLGHGPAQRRERR